MYQVIDGKKISQEIKDELKEKAAAMAKGGKKVALAVIQGRNESGFQQGSASEQEKGM